MRDGWKQSTLGEAVQVTMGRQRSPKHATGDHVLPYVRAANVKDGRLDVDDILQMNFTPREQEVFALRPGDVLVTEGCGTIGQIGAAARWNGEIEGTVCFQNTLLRLRAINGVTDPAFVDVWARHAFASGLFAAVASGTNIFHIGARQSSLIPLLLPPLRDQRRIADLVAQLDGVADALSTAVLKTAVAEFAFRVDAFDNPQIEAVPLRSLCDEGGIQIGPFGSQLHASDYVQDGVPTVMPKDIVDGRIDDSSIARIGRDDWQRLEKHHLAGNDIVIPRRGDLAKRALVTPEQAGWLCGTGSVRVRVAKADPRAVFEALSSEHSNRWLHDNAVGITMPNLNTAIVSSIPIRLPADGGLSTVEVLKALAGFRSACESERHSTEVLRIAIVADLLSGDCEIPESYDELLENAS